MPTGKTMTANEMKAAIARLEETIPDMAPGDERKQARDKVRYYRRRIVVMESQEVRSLQAQELAQVRASAAQWQHKAEGYMMDRNRYMKAAQHWRWTALAGWGIAALFAIVSVVLADAG